MANYRNASLPAHLLSLSSSTNSALQGALLIKAQSRIVELEDQVSQLKQEAAVERVKQDLSTLASRNIGITDVERELKLEHERTQLVEELAKVKAKLAEAEKQQDELSNKYQILSERYETETGAQKAQVESIMVQMIEMDSLNDEMHGELNDVKLLQCEHQQEQVEELQENYSRAMQALQTRLTQLESTESKLLSSQAQVTHLQHQLRLYRQDSHFTDRMKDKILHFEEIERQLQLTMEENQALRQDRMNTDLLRYQVQSLQQDCKQLGDVMEEVTRLRVENRELKAGHGKGQDTPSSALQIQLAELQQREIVALKEFGELSTQFKVCQEELDLCHSRLQKLQQKLACTQDSLTAGEERIHKLERRLIFVMKERDGCVNVLNSYKLDSGVDGLMKELLAEKERELVRSQERIIELEAQLEGKKTLKRS